MFHRARLRSTPPRDTIGSYSGDVREGPGDVRSLSAVTRSWGILSTVSKPDILLAATFRWGGGSTRCHAYVYNSGADAESIPPVDPRPNGEMGTTLSPSAPQPFKHDPLVWLGDMLVYIC
jgi:hypothetical protein